MYGLYRPAIGVSINKYVHVYGIIKFEWHWILLVECSPCPSQIFARRRGIAFALPVPEMQGKWRKAVSDFLRRNSAWQTWYAGIAWRDFFMEQTEPRMNSRYTELARQLIHDIGSGKHAVGSTLPSEIELSEIYGVSRTTVRSALQMVQNLGLISRRKRAGIRIEAAKPRHTYTQSLSNIEELMQFAALTERHVQAVTELACDEALAAQLGCEVQQRWMKVELLRVNPENPELPICWTDVYLDPLIGAGIRRRLRKNSGLICEMVEEKYGRIVAEVRQEIRSVRMTEHLAAKLAAVAGSPALEITRHYVDQQGIAFEVSVSVSPADRFTYAFRLRRQFGA